jgi:D-alanyl-lipoteichoic acid acyltransferase DltB (MBOAT superfamily)
MFFTSYQFILGFLPITFVGFVLAHRLGGWNWAINFLGAASLAFYGMFGIPLLFILLGSILFNYTFGNIIAGIKDKPTLSRNALLLGIATNLGLLGYLKYTNFLVDVANQLMGYNVAHHDLVVPIGVSFFTFIQIGYLIDAHNGQLLRHNFGRYVVFSAFFPCVTAGPLVLQREMMEQMEDPKHRALDLRRIIVGLTMFGMGLFKKVVLADSIAPYANLVFDGAAQGMPLDPVSSWIGSVCYALQLYFDFSGYSDMAIGLGTIFGFKLPLNFDSPFKATNISDFWRRWHMTMTRFFTNYIYSGLAMNGMRRGARWGLGSVGKFVLVAAMPAIVTFMVAGVWHGSGWTYMIYGVMHGFAIATFLAWREFSKIQLPAVVGWAITMATVVSGLVMFRSVDVTTAMSILGNMWGVASQQLDTTMQGLDVARACSMIVLLGAITQLLPNTQQILHLDWPSSDAKPATTELDAGLLAWRPSFGPALVTAAIYTVALTSIGAGSNFLYYKF